MPPLAQRSLTSATLKRRRAKEHLDNLKARIEAFTNETSQSVTADFNEQSREYVLYAHIGGEPDRSWPLLVGEFLHNLRSSLDAIMWQLAIPNPVNPSAIQFPIFKDAVERREAGRRISGYDKSGLRQLQDVDPTAEPVVKALQPCFAKGPEAHPLWILNQLNNIDKHRTVLLAVAQVGIAGFAYRRGDPSDVTILNSPEGALENGAEIYRLRIREGSDVQLQPSVSFKVALWKSGTVMDEWPITNVLGDLYRFVNQEVFPAFKQFFP